MGAFLLFDPYAFLAAVNVSAHTPTKGVSNLASLAEGQAGARSLGPVRTSTPSPGLAGFTTLAAPTATEASGWSGAAGHTLAAKTAKPATPANSAEAEVHTATSDRLLQLWTEGVARLNAERAPVDVPPRRWRQFVYDTTRFLDSGFAKQAAALGWNAHDLFGCDRDRPFARIDSMGMVWLLDGDRLVALTEQSARIETKTGSTLTYRRKPGDPGRVLAWQFGP